jgi:hypothetical protein
MEGWFRGEETGQTGVRNFGGLEGTMVERPKNLELFLSAGKARCRIGPAKQADFLGTAKNKDKTDATQPAAVRNARSPPFDLFSGPVKASEGLPAGLTEPGTSHEKSHRALCCNKASPHH